MITKWYEIICDGCGCVQHYSGTKEEAERDFKKEGTAVIKAEKHYCSEVCYKMKKDKNDR